MVTVVSQSLFFVGQGRGSAAQAVSIIHRNPSSIFASTLLLIEFRPHPRPSLSQSSRHCRPSGLPRPSLSKSSLHRIQFAGPGPVYDYLGRRLQVPVVIGVAAQGHSPTSFKLSSIQIIESSRHGISPVYHSSKSSHQSSPPPRPEFRQSVIHRPGSRVDGPLQAQPHTSPSLHQGHQNPASGIIEFQVRLLRSTIFARSAARNTCHSNFHSSNWAGSARVQF